MTPVTTRTGPTTSTTMSRRRRYGPGAVSNPGASRVRDTWQESARRLAGLRRMQSARRAGRGRAMIPDRCLALPPAVLDRSDLTSVAKLVATALNDRFARFDPVHLGWEPEAGPGRGPVDRARPSRPRRVVCHGLVGREETDQTPTGRRLWLPRASRPPTCTPARRAPLPAGAAYRIEALTVGQLRDVTTIECTEPKENHQEAVHALGRGNGRRPRISHGVRLGPSWGLDGGAADPGGDPVAEARRRRGAGRAGEPDHAPAPRHAAGHVRVRPEVGEHGGRRRGRGLGGPGPRLREGRGGDPEQPPLPRSGAGAARAGLRVPAAGPSAIGAVETHQAPRGCPRRSRPSGVSGADRGRAGRGAGAGPGAGEAFRRWFQPDGGGSSGAARRGAGTGSA